MKTKSHSEHFSKVQLSGPIGIIKYGMLFKNVILVIVVVLVAFAIFVFGYKIEGFQSGLEYSAYPTTGALDVDNRLSLSQTPGSCKKVNGISGVFCQEEKRNTGIDLLANNTSSMSCEYSGITKSGGNVCLSPEQRKLLTTRGGNSVHDSQIG